MSADDIQRTISVTGVGRAAAAADILLLSLAVDTQAVTTSDALAANNKQATAVLSALKATMGPGCDIQTTQLSIDPVMARQDQNDTHPPKIVGYRVQNGLRTKLRDIQCVGWIIDATVQAGATRLASKVSFFLRRPFKLARRSPDASNRRCERPSPTADGWTWCRTGKRDLDLGVGAQWSNAPGVRRLQRRGLHSNPVRRVRGCPAGHDRLGDLHGIGLRSLPENPTRKKDTND